MARKNPHAVALGRKGGKASAKVRTLRIPPDRRQEIARKAAEARWAMKKGKGASP